MNDSWSLLIVCTFNSLFNIYGRLKRLFDEVIQCDWYQATFSHNLSYLQIDYSITSFY